jgi:hypothetical protein
MTEVMRTNHWSISDTTWWNIPESSHRHTSSSTVIFCSWQEHVNPCTQTELNWAELHRQIYELVMITVQIFCHIVCPSKNLDDSVKVTTQLSLWDSLTYNVCPHLYISSCDGSTVSVARVLKVTMTDEAGLSSDCSAKMKKVWLKGLVNI